MSGMNPLARRAPRLASALLGTSLAATLACAAPARAATLSVTLAELDEVLDTLDEGAADDGTGAAALRALVSAASTTRRPTPMSGSTRARRSTRGTTAGGPARSPAAGPVPGRWRCS